MAVISRQFALVVIVVLVRLVDHRLTGRSESDVSVSATFKPSLIDLVTTLGLLPRNLPRFGACIAN